MEAFVYSFEAVMPMLLLMLLGFGMKRAEVFDDSLLRKMNSFTFRFGISAMMFCNTYSLDSLEEIHLDLVGVVVATLLLLTLIGIVEAQAFTSRRDRRGVMIQNAFRSNFAIIGTTLATALSGEAGAAAAVSIQAPAIIYFNVVSVVCLAWYTDRPGRRVSVSGILRQIAVNPMILGQAAGLLCLAGRELLPRDAQGELIFQVSRDLSFLYAAEESLAEMAAPLILILLGARVDLRAARAMKRELAAGVIQRLGLAPAIGIGTAFLAQRMGLLQVTPAVLSALIGVYGSPVASASAVMAEEMGGDAELARQYVVLTSGCSMATLFLWIFLLRSVHLL